MQPQYTTVGHITVDVFADGERRAGGAALYSALQAARLGLRAHILTRGRAREIEALIEPHRHELSVEIQPAEHTTTLRTLGAGAARSQRVLAWAGPIAGSPPLAGAIVHLAPVARELPSHWSAPGARGAPRALSVLTPQGLARRWSAGQGEIQLAPLDADAAALGERCDAIVVSAQERAACAALIDRARAAGAVVAITDGAAPTTILAPGEPELSVVVPALDRPRDDLGAGDVFAAAFFVALSEGRPPAAAARFANAAAAVRMRGAGAAAIGDRDAIEARERATADAGRAER